MTLDCPECKDHLKEVIRGSAKSRVAVLASDMRWTLDQCREKVVGWFHQDGHTGWWA